MRSWVTGISGNRFTENLYYNQNTANLPNFTASYNGNIAGMQWSVPAEGLGYNRAYSFAYDGLNRLTAGNYTGGTAGAYNETFGYDKMGNITTLNRNENGAGLNQLTLNYTGNQLLTAYDALAVTKLYGSEAFDNKANLSTEYLYDTNGSTTYDANSGISTIQYNVLNLPNLVQFTAGHKNVYTYGADGKKLATNNYTLHSAINVPQGSISTLPSNAGDYTKVTTDYVGNMIYENGSLKEILLPEGYWQSGTYYYYLKDHLGDNRVTINSSGAVIEKSHYYPSGMRFYPESTSNSAALPYRYNGKELEAMNGLNQYDYGARRRDAGLPMWTAVDPLAEDHYEISLYVYAMNNPINYIDPDGRDTTINKTILEITVVGKAPNNKTVNLVGINLIGLSVDSPVSGFWGNLSYYLFGRTFFDGKNTWNVGKDGVVNSIAPITGIIDVSVAGKVSAYIKLVRFTKGLKGSLQDHHLIEVRHLKRLLLSAKDAPAVILNRSDHIEMTKALQQLLPYGRSYTKEELINAYKQAYKNEPEWINAVMDYLK